MNKQFLEDVNVGLDKMPKQIPSKYFYDKIGDELFMKIMQMPEYYLTRAEFDIFKNKTQQVIDLLQIEKNKYFDLIELGAGNGKKTKELLSALNSDNFDFSYLPIDISQHALNHLSQSLQKQIPDVNVIAKQGEYFEVLSALKNNANQKVILFLGSNIGNLSDKMATKFIYQLGENLKTDDKLFLGVDLIKASEIVLPAYNDAAGITSAFNLNLLQRMNSELQADFNLSNFKHVATYDEKKGVAKSYIESKYEQTVTIEALNKTVDFTEGERIHTEISRKYSDEIIQNIIADTDFEIVGKLTDSKNYFADYILNRK